MKKKKNDIIDIRRNKCNACNGDKVSMMVCHKCKEKLL